MQKIADQFKQEGAVIYAISSEGPTELNRMRDAVRAEEPFVFLSDPDGEAASHYAGFTKGQSFLQSATFVIGKDGKIKLGFVEEDYKIRPEVEQVLQAVQSS